MKLNKAYKIEIEPTDEQIELFHKAFGTARFVYNHLLSTCETYYNENKSSYPKKELKRYLTVLKQEYKEWMYDVPKSVHQHAYDDLMRAYDNFFRTSKNKSTRKVGKPTYKKKNKSNKSFTMDNDRFEVLEHHIDFSVFGKVKMKETNYIPRKNVKYSFATISYRGGKYFCSVSLHKYESNIKGHSDEIVGIDLGIKTLATCSNGIIFENPKFYKKNLKQLKRIQRKFSKAINVKDKNGNTVFSNRKQKLNLKLSKMHYRIYCLRQDYLHKMTTYLVKTKPDTIVIEDLNVKGMMKNHKLAQSIADASFGEFKRMIEYKTKRYSINLVKVNRFFPSSKLCNRCGCINEDLTLADRIFSCDCGYIQDRDLNASLNLKDYVQIDRM